MSRVTSNPRRWSWSVFPPRDLRPRLVGLIDAEIANAKAGKPAAVWAKMNSVVDPAVIEKLYEASAAGVEIDLIVPAHPGICLPGGVFFI